jgi:flavodoxin
MKMKKVLVVFDSNYGNTEKLGREIAAGIDESGLAESKVINIDDVESEDLSVFDGALFGSPIHAFRATRGIKGAVKTAAKKGLKAKLVASFDTYQAPGHVGKAAGQIEGELKKRIKGAKIISPGLSALVLDRKGPLKDDELPKAHEFGKKFAQELGA